MVFGNKLDRLITTYGKQGGRADHIHTLAEMAEKFPDLRTTTDFQITQVTEYQIWRRRETGELFAVVGDEFDRQNMLTRIEERRLRDEDYRKKVSSRRKYMLDHPDGPKNMGPVPKYEF